MTIFIHGFGSSGRGGKSKLFREYFKSIDKPFIAPSLSYVPRLAISTLEELIESYDEVNLIGSSLGGYYALYLSEKYGLKTVLINPATKSAKTLKRAVSLTGYAPNFYDNSSFEWTELHLKMLEEYNTGVIESDKYFLLLQKGDDLLDYRDAVAKVPNASMIIEEEGTHQFEGIEKHFERIVEFLDFEKN
jgi:predicted esterase YcpF (UPF0227 family)